MMKDTIHTLNELSLIRAIVVQLLRSDESTKQQLLNSIDSQFFSLAENINLPFSQIVSIYNLPQDEVDSICKSQRQSRIDSHRLNQIEAPLYFKDTMNSLQNDAQLNYEVNVLGLNNTKNRS